MAPKGQKRGGFEKAVPVGKKPKTDPLMNAVVNSLEHEDAGLSDSSREMLLAGLSGSLGIASNERHSLQTLVVSMIGDVVSGVETKLKEAIDASEAKIADVETSRCKQEAIVKEAEAALAKSIEAVDARKVALQEASKVVAGARADMSKKQQEHRKVNAVLTEVQGRRDALGKGIDVHLKSILECDEPDSFDGAAHYKSLSPLLSTLSMDASLVQTLPNCCAKKPNSRGSFEKLAIDELSKNLAAKAAEMDTMVAEAKATVDAHDAAATAAAAAHDAAAAAQSKASQESVTALASQRDASATVETARAALKACLAEHEKATVARCNNAAALDNFRTNNVASFEVLRDRSTQQDHSAAADVLEAETHNTAGLDAPCDQHDAPAEIPGAKDVSEDISNEIAASLVNAAGA